MPKAAVPIRSMTAGDLPAAMRLAGEAGWNQVEADWRRFLAMQPDGCFVAQRREDCVGTVVACIFDEVAWIAMLLVDAAQRGQGIGRSLIEHALAFLDERGIDSVRLDATPLGQPLYEQLGFRPQFELARYAGVPNAAISLKNPAPVRAAWPGDVEELLTLDRTVTRTHRRKLIERLIVERPHSLQVAEQRGQIVGYLTMRSGRFALQFGPCVACGDAGPALVAEAAASYKGQAVFLDVPIPNSPAVQFAESLGLKVERKLVRMCRGREVQEDLARLWASSGPELG